MPPQSCSLLSCYARLACRVRRCSKNDQASVKLPFCHPSSPPSMLLRSETLSLRTPTTDSSCNPLGGHRGLVPRTHVVQAPARRLSRRVMARRNAVRKLLMDHASIFNGLLSFSAIGNLCPFWCARTTNTGTEDGDPLGGASGWGRS